MVVRRHVVALVYFLEVRVVEGLNLCLEHEAILVVSVLGVSASHALRVDSLVLRHGLASLR